MGVLSTLSHSALDTLDAYLPSVARRVPTSRRGVATAAAVLAAAALLRAIWARRVPRHLRHLVAHPAWKTTWLFASGLGFMEAVLVMGKDTARAAYARGLVAAPDHTPGNFVMYFLGGWAVSICNSEDFKLVVNHQDTFDRVTFDELGLGDTMSFLGANIAQTPLHDWKRHRKVVTPAFRRGWPTSLFATPARRMLEHFDALSASGSEVDIADWMQRVTLDALCVSAFGREFNAVDDPHNATVQLYHRILDGMFAPVRTVFPRLAAWLPSTQVFRRDVAEFNEYIFALIDAKRAANAARAGKGDDEEADRDSRDLLDLMIAAQDAGDFSREDLRANTVAFFLAGHDTTANALTFTIYLLGLHPDVQAKARAEVLAALGVPGAAAPSPAAADAAYPTNEQQAHLAYLTHVLQEAQRLFPSIGVLPIRRVTTPTTLSDGTRLPAGAHVSPNILLLQRSRAVWGEDADEFRPERWAKFGGGKAGEDALPLHPGAFDYAWVPFSGGQRICLGMQFAIIEQRTIMAMLLARYEWTTVGDAAALSGTPKTVPGILTHPVGIRVVFKKRGGQ
ncbi:hypothetical protein H9P43_000159 [Blastocladiella emersonii ATCC 22665]|nr:hypothetical protein H9P43_000159 [Blastocladiella emersonii ATCC 22665]